MAILIVEDNPVNARLLTLMLEAGGYQTVVTGNGKEALARMSEMETQAIQLIITDYMTPSNGCRGSSAMGSSSKLSTNTSCSHG
jgi:CheY-like chemotaxis protein